MSPPSVLQHLCVLLACPDLDVVLAVLNLLYVFSKRSNFISRLSNKKRMYINHYLEYLGEVRAFLNILLIQPALYPHMTSMCIQAFSLLSVACSHGEESRMDLGWPSAAPT